MYKSIGFQSPVTPMMEGILDLHNHIFFFLILVFVFVFWMFGSIVYVFWYRINYPKVDADYLRRVDCVSVERLTHATLLEVVWTIIPSIILVFIAVPSFGLLYAMDEVTDPVLTVKVVGHQWYWSYQFSTPSFLEPFYDGVFQFDSYMVDEKDLRKGDYRLLEVDNPLVLPFDVPIRLIVTSDDVIHSFALPQLGLKVDAVPGRLNQQQIYLKRGGVFYGQCSELCGVNHGFMPVVVRSVDLDVFKNYLLVDPNYLYLVEEARRIEREAAAEAAAKAAAEAECARQKAITRETVRQWKQLDEAALRSGDPTKAWPEFTRRALLDENGNWKRFPHEPPCDHRRPCQNRDMSGGIMSKAADAIGNWILGKK